MESLVVEVLQYNVSTENVLCKYLFRNHYN